MGETREIYCCVIPDKKTNQKLKQIQEIIKKKCKLTQNEYPLHICIKSPFFAEYPEGLQKLTNKLKKRLNKYKPFNIETNGYDIFSDRVLVLKIKENQKLNELEKEVIETAKEIDLKKNKYNPNVNKLNEKQKTYLKKYGDYRIFEYYIPHLTLIFNIKNEKQKIKGILNNTKTHMKFNVNKLIIVDRKTKQFIKEIKFGSEKEITLLNT